MLNIDFKKGGGLVPAIIQDHTTLQVLMVGYMNEQALDKTMKDGRVTFFSRSRNELWTKGHTSGNYLHVREILTDCDSDAILILAQPEGPVCHSGSFSCFGEESARSFLYRLEEIVSQRIDEDSPDSYTNKIFKKGINKIAQKVGEEAVELIIEAKDDDPLLFMNEAADLLYHLLILLKAKNLSLYEIEKLLFDRHKR
ncbi:MAG: bifunctional phosphoribosyl-AMP cyclohydrolase/phosphoribosyl-ATP diphosphatase HisIE [Bacteroidales bacterium]|jgi:phosphoribosyl-ATP pyrophosphohydrolase/phosphoribosyl-AMP cyclohydrolase|nr:bifunctional phosphoribosyl-AMP cyclohydrolase/phosphoribosyl-ATP diphosphatase HisIE [Bacteroidales bacterium]